MLLVSAKKKNAAVLNGVIKMPSGNNECLRKLTFPICYSNSFVRTVFLLWERKLKKKYLNFPIYPFFFLLISLLASEQAGFISPERIQIYCLGDLRPHSQTIDVNRKLNIDFNKLCFTGRKERLFTKYSLF